MKYLSLLLLGALLLMPDIGFAQSKVQDATKTGQVVSAVVPQVDAPVVSSPDVLLDNFNRPDGPIGPMWTEQTGTTSVASNRAIGTNRSLATFNGGSGDVAGMDVFNHSSLGLQYAALVLRYADLNNNLFFKVQNQGGTGFNKGACYYGNN